LTSYVETALLRAIWYPSTVATLSREIKKVIYEGLQTTSDDADGQIGFKLHDFGGRGSTSSESAMLGGMGHLVNFMGTDTIEAIIGARDYYHEEMAGFSIPASEHSTITAWGKAKEYDAYKNLLQENPTGLVACVSDSYDIMHAVKHIWGDALKSMVLARKGTLVIRPDSGDPTQVPLDVIKEAMNAFGFQTNAKGYKLLPPQVRVIQGDGMNYDTIKILIKNCIASKISLDNIAFGMGGGLLQKLDRDTLNYAMKASAIKTSDNEVWQPIYKDPMTDKGKSSKRGRLALVKRHGTYETIPHDDLANETNHLVDVYKNGELLIDQSFTSIRDNARL